MKGKGWSFYKVCNSNNDEGQNRKTLSFPKPNSSKFDFFSKTLPFSDPKLSSRNRIWYVFCDFSISTRPAAPSLALMRRVTWRVWSI
ncbi:hypothetical protein OIU84_007209 [Salix udensis]|uniref:Uncharacterized protein n=1 Tax=Salix udensis TaxID=889485 RepID=A0AAD6NZ60_9ROSI|nr:hypothetical protein OIU84_007209 [Salix udensis]